MPAAAEAARRRIASALLRRRAPGWALGALPWLLLLLTPPGWAVIHWSDGWANGWLSGWSLQWTSGWSSLWWCGLLLWLLWIAADALRLRHQTRRQWPRWLDAAVPALEDSSALLVRASTPIAQLQQQRLLGRLATALDRPALQLMARQQATNGWPAVALSVLAAALVTAWPAGSGGRNVAPVAAGLAIPAGPATLRLQVTPPAYTGVAAFDTAPRELQVPQHSQVRWCLQGAASAAPPALTPMPAPAHAPDPVLVPVPVPEPEPIELSDGTRLPWASTAGAGCAVWTASESMFWRWRGVRHTLHVLADQAPTITVRAPGELLHTLGPADTTVRMAVAVGDDYRVVDASLHLTLARGSGENVRFSDREMPLPRGADPRLRLWDKTWTLAELGLQPGDDLYFFVRASDNAPGRAHISTSPTYTLRLPGSQAAEEQASALPMIVKPENLRSQRQVIIDTEQLLADLKANPRLAPAQLRARSEDIAADQAQLRRRYGQFLGEESSLFGDAHAQEHDNEAAHGDTHGSDTAAQDMVARFGHAHDQAENATLFDEGTKKILRRALAAMWDAEKALRAITPRPALPFEYRALEAVKQLQQADRIYLHRTAFVPPPLKEDKRLTGDVVGTHSYGRVQATVTEAVPAPLRELMATLATDAPLPALWSSTARSWIRERLAADADRLAAQRAVQDVLDGCAACRPALAAWLRNGITDSPVHPQAATGVSTPFTQAWRQAAGS